MDARVFLLLMAGRMVGDYLYSWGGEDAGEGGFDCSGFASSKLGGKRSVGRPGVSNLRMASSPRFDAIV